jgi:hypothetical protein
MGTFTRGTSADAAASPLSPLQRPTPSYASSGNPNLLSTYQSSAAVPASLPPTDEGKMSVAIDFGENRATYPARLICAVLGLTGMVQELLFRVW